MADDPVPQLPLDIPWRRLCVTEDMIDTGKCDRDGPPRWNPSIAVFEYEPPADQQVYDDLVVSYLKVTCTITGHTVEEVSQVGSLIPYYYDPSVGDFLLSKTARQDACYGALVHVTVRPGDADQAEKLDEYPYIADLQPKKRELYELVTQTGSAMSRSLEEVQIRKGTTTATNTEVLDSGQQVDWSALGAVGGAAAGSALGGPAGAVVGGALGSELGGLLGGKDEKSVNQAQSDNLLTTDRSTEKREEYSHTTHLAQMYHQLTSYHLGTNRVLFFVLPRPHVVQSLPTFVNGPRVLEGLQEFLLTVVRPRSVERLCVNVILELAHVSFERGVPRRSEAWTFHESANWPVTHFHAPRVNNPEKFAPPVTAGPYPYEPPPGWEFDFSENLDGYRVVSKPDAVSVDVDIDKVHQRAQITLKVPAASATLLQSLGLGSGLYRANYAPTSVGLEFLLRRIGEEGQRVQDIPVRLYTWAHLLCCCPDSEGGFFSVPASVGYEGVLTTRVDAQLGTSMSIAAANQLTSDIGRALIDSVSAPDRYPYGEVGLVEAQFLADGIARRIGAPGHPDNTPAAEIEGLRDDIREALCQRGDLSRADVLHMTLRETRDRFGLTLEQAAHLRRAALRLEEPELAPEDRWDPRSVRDERPVPDVVGLPLEHAKAAIRTAGLAVSSVTVTDDPGPDSVVLYQEPAAGSMRRGSSGVALEVASGLRVRIPDIVGRPLGEGVCMLRQAGLESEPRLRFERRKGAKSFSVVESDPPSGSYVTPHGLVTLRVIGRTTAGK